MNRSYFLKAHISYLNYFQSFHSLSKKTAFCLNCYYYVCWPWIHFWLFARHSFCQFWQPMEPHLWHCHQDWQILKNLHKNTKHFSVTIFSIYISASICLPLIMGCLDFRCSLTRVVSKSPSCIHKCRKTSSKAGFSYSSMRSLGVPSANNLPNLE